MPAWDRRMSGIEKIEGIAGFGFWDQPIIITHHHQLRMARKSNNKEESEAVIDPALRETESDKTMPSSPRRHNSPPEPPHSPSPSTTHSAPRRSPPMPSHPYHDRYRQDLGPPHHHSGYLYAPPPPPPPFDPRYDHHHHYQPAHHLPEHPGHHYSPSGLPTHYIPHSMPHPPPPPPQGYAHHYPMPGQPPVSIVHTSDANTKLTDGIRRRCFNCCTTDTSTWRRSNLSPGKVLCNKCGLFERTHSRPRPEQFPHKRGALASTNLRGRTPPGGAPSSNQLPPISAATAPYPYHHGPGGEYPHHPPPPHPLPGLQSWHGNNTSSGSTSSSTSAIHTQNGISNGPSSANDRRIIDSPRLNSSSNSPPVRTFEEPPAADPHARSHPPSPPLPLSRSSTANHTSSSSPPPTRDSQA